MDQSIGTSCYYFEDIVLVILLTCLDRSSSTASDFAATAVAWHSNTASVATAGHTSFVVTSQESSAASADHLLASLAVTAADRTTVEELIIIDSSKVFVKLRCTTFYYFQCGKGNTCYIVL